MNLIKNFSDLVIGDYIKVSQINGPIVDRLSFSGKLILIKGKMVEIKTIDGIVGIGWEMLDMQLEFYKLDQKPSGWGKSGDTLKKKKPEIKPILKTKKEQVFELVKNNPKKKKSVLLSLAKKEIGGDANALSNFIQLAMAKIK